jgi:hypothetical protein
VCKDFARSAEVKNPSRIREQSSGGTMFLYTQVRLNGIEFTEEDEQRSRPLRILNSSKCWKKSAKSQEEQQLPSDQSRESGLWICVQAV